MSIGFLIFFKDFFEKQNRKIVQLILPQFITFYPYICYNYFNYAYNEVDNIYAEK